MQETTYDYNDKIYFSFNANSSLITYQPNLKNRCLKNTTKTLLKGPKKDMKKLRD